MKRFVVEPSVHQFNGLHMAAALICGALLVVLTLVSEIIEDSL
jgi:hypothetical protein